MEHFKVNGRVACHRGEDGGRLGGGWRMLGGGEGEGKDAEKIQRECSVKKEMGAENGRGGSVWVGKKRRVRGIDVCVCV